MQDLAQHFAVLKRHGYAKDDALILLMRLQLMKIIKVEIRRRGWSQREAAKILNVSQPRIAEISALATDKFSLETLIKYLLRLNLKAALSVAPGKQYVRAARQRTVSTKNSASGNKKDQPTKTRTSRKTGRDCADELSRRGS